MHPEQARQAREREDGAPTQRDVAWGQGERGGRVTVGEGERAWFEKEVVAVLPELFATALRLAKNRADAEDLVAGTVAKAWARLDTLRDRDRFCGWLVRILTNTFVSGRRAAAVRPPLVSLDADAQDEESFSLFERLHQPFLLWWGNPEQEFLSKLLREDLEAAIDALPEPFRVVVVLADVQGLCYEEVAQALEIPIGTVRSRLARARSRLQKALWEHGRDAGLTKNETNRSEAEVSEGEGRAVGGGEGGRGVGANDRAEVS